MTRRIRSRTIRGLLTPLRASLAAGLVAGCAAGGAAPGGTPAAREEGRRPALPVAQLLGPMRGGVPGQGPLGRSLAAQARAARTVPGAEVEAVESAVLVRLPADLLFERGQSSLRPAARGRLRGLAAALGEPHTRLLVTAHADASAPEATSLERSRARAEAVRAALVAEGVASERIAAAGLGGALPLASNATPEGRQRNRRVEVEIRPDAELRAAPRADRRRAPRHEANAP